MNLKSQLTQLETAQLVHPVEHQDQMCIFKNALTQQAAYHSLLRKRRMEIHRLVAQTYEELYANQLDAYAGILAHHYGRAYDYAKTVAYALRAGDQAFHVYAYAEARLYYQQALDALAYLNDTDELRRQRVDTLVKHVNVSFPFQASNLSFDYLRQAESIAQELFARNGRHDDRLRLARIHYWLGRMHVYRNQTVEAIEAMMRVLDEAGDSNDDALLAFPSAVIGRIMNIKGQFGAASVLLRQALEPMERSNNVPEWIITLGHLGLALAARGEYAEGLAYGQRALEHALEIKSENSTAEAHVILAVIYYMGGDYAPMHDAADACIKIAEPTASLLYVFTAYATRALASSFLGHHPAALQDIERAQTIGKSMSARRAYSDWVASASAQVFLNAGKIDQALRASQQAVELAQSLGGIFALGLAERVWANALACTHANWDDIESHLASSLSAFDTGEARLEAARTHFAWGTLSTKYQKIELARAQWALTAEQFRVSGLEKQFEQVPQLTSE